MAFVVVTGVPELNRTFREVGERVADRASRRGVQFTGQIIAREAKAASPKPITGNLRRQIKFKWDKIRGQVVNGKVTLGSRHGHLVTMGTKPRVRLFIGGKFAWTKGTRDPRSKSTGRVAGSHFFRNLVASNSGRYVRILQERLKFYVVEEINRAAKGR